MAQAQKDFGGARFGGTGYNKVTVWANAGVSLPILSFTLTGSPTIHPRSVAVTLPTINDRVFLTKYLFTSESKATSAAVDRVMIKVIGNSVNLCTTAFASRKIIRHPDSEIDPSTLVKRLHPPFDGLRYTPGPLYYTDVFENLVDVEEVWAEYLLPLLSNYGLEIHNSKYSLTFQTDYDRSWRVSRFLRHIQKWLNFKGLPDSVVDMVRSYGFDAEYQNGGTVTIKCGMLNINSNGFRDAAELVINKSSDDLYYNDKISCGADPPFKCGQSYTYYNIDTLSRLSESNPDIFNKNLSGYIPVDFKNKGYRIVINNFDLEYNDSSDPIVVLRGREKHTFIQMVLMESIKVCHPETAVFYGFFDINLTLIVKEDEDSLNQRLSVNLFVNASVDFEII
jgi:hypothetical protein